MDTLKKLKIVVGTNSLTMARHQAYSNHCQLWFRFGRDYDYDFVFNNPDRMSIDRMRNQCAEIALSIDADYLLFLDDDVLVPKDCLKKLIAADADIIAGDVMIRGYPFDHMCFEFVEGGKGLKSMAEIPEGIFDVGAVGFSLCLIKVDLLRKLPKPYFVTGISNTEDIYFCVKAKQFLPETTIKVDASIQCAHILWDETISIHNRGIFQEYYEKQNPHVLAEKESQDRRPSYLNLIHEADTDTADA